MKATSIFGGVQVFNIIIGIIRSKFIAVLLGPTGMGIAGLLTATTHMIAGLSSFGLGTSAVKDISTANATGNSFRISIIVTVFRRLVWITGLLGLLMTLLFSPWLSQITFGNKNYTWAFILISITLLLNQISTGQSVLLRGMRQIGYLAKSGLVGSALGLITTVPLYYLYGIQGIVPAIILTSIISLFLTWYFSRKLDIKSIFVSKTRTIAEGKGMLKMGFMISLSGLITMGAAYIVRIYISNNGGVDQVGLYNAGFAIINTYVGLIFTAMSTDYYPRLSAVADSNEKSKVVINQQAEIAILILAPVIMIFLIYINWVVILLYSTQFIPVNEMILYSALGMIFRAASWSIAFIFLAKGASKLYFWSELIANIYLLGFNLIGYKLWGLTGLGISFLTAYMLYLVQVYFVSRIKYEFNFTQGFYKIFGLQLLLAIMCFIAVKFTDTPYSYLVGSVLFVVSALYSYTELDKRLDFKSIFLGIKNRF
jgi:O-antigen/teichoic acid export membrane protein